MKPVEPILVGAAFRHMALPGRQLADLQRSLTSEDLLVLSAIFAVRAKLACARIAAIAVAARRQQAE